MKNPISADKIYGLLQKIRAERPLVHVVTNFVVMNQTANALLALGASPTMSWADEDLEYLSGISDALCINTGTPTKDRVTAMERLMKLAEDSGKPVVFDPVGSGAGPHRTGIARELCTLAPTKIIRGNASEICSLVDEDASTGSTYGVENAISPADARKILIDHGRASIARPDQKNLLASRTEQLLSGKASCLLVSGQEDIALTPSAAVYVQNGSELMSMVTGTGCILSALTAAFYAVSKTALEAAVAASAVSGIAGEIAAEKVSGPGSFLSCFIDELYSLSQDIVEQKYQVTTRNM